VAGRAVLAEEKVALALDRVVFAEEKAAPASGKVVLESGKAVLAEDTAARLQCGSRTGCKRLHHPEAVVHRRNNRMPLYAPLTVRSGSERQSEESVRNVRMKVIQYDFHKKSLWNSHTHHLIDFIHASTAGREPFYDIIEKSM